MGRVEDEVGLKGAASSRSHRFSIGDWERSTMQWRPVRRAKARTASRRLTRRAFIAYCAIPVGASLLAACTPTAPAQPAAPAATQPPLALQTQAPIQTPAPATAAPAAAKPAEKPAEKP